MIDLPATMSLSVQFIPVDENLPMIGSNIVPVASDRPDTYTITPTEVEDAAGTKQVSVPEDEFDVTFRPSEGTEPVTEKITFATDAVSATATGESGEILTVSLFSCQAKRLE